MNIKRFFYAFSFLLIAANAVMAQENKSDREKSNFNYGWKLNVGKLKKPKTQSLMTKNGPPSIFLLPGIKQKHLD